MKQIVVAGKTRSGLVADISEILGSQGINIETLDAEETSGFDVVTLTVDRYIETLQALHDAGIEAFTEDAVVIRMRDEPGSLAKIARRFSEANMHMRSLRLISRSEGQALVAVSMDRSEEALELIQDLIISQ